MPRGRPPKRDKDFYEKQDLISQIIIFPTFTAVLITLGMEQSSSLAEPLLISM